jgi:hypothetical protein
MVGSPTVEQLAMIAATQKAALRRDLIDVGRLLLDRRSSSREDGANRGNNSKE